VNSIGGVKDTIKLNIIMKWRDYMNVN